MRSRPSSRSCGFSTLAGARVARRTCQGHRRLPDHHPDCLGSRSQGFASGLRLRHGDRGDSALDRVGGLHPGPVPVSLARSGRFLSPPCPVHRGRRPAVARPRPLPAVVREPLSGTSASPGRSSTGSTVPLRLRASRRRRRISCSSCSWARRPPGESSKRHS